MSRTTRVSRYQKKVKKHSPTHTYRGHQSSLICFIHLIWSMASSLFNLHAWLHNLSPYIIVIKLHIKEMHFKNHWAHTLYKKIFNTFKLLTDCTFLLHCLCHSCAMVVSKPIHFEELTSITSFNNILFYFCIKTTHCSTMIVFAHVVAMFCVIFIGNFNIYDHRTNNHLRNVLLLLHPPNDKCPGGASCVLGVRR